MKHKNILKEAGVLLVAAILVLTSLFMFTPITIASKTAPTTVLLFENFEGPWGPYGGNPPAGWTIEDHGSENPPVWNNNDWHKYYYSTAGSNTARVYYSPYEQMDEWLITPTINCGSYGTVTLEFWQYFYFYAVYPGYGNITISTNGGSTWDTIDEYDVSQTAGVYSYDISFWAAYKSNAQIRFRYYSTGSQGRFWYLDDVEITGEMPDVTPPITTHILNPPNPDGDNGWYKSCVTVTLDATDVDSGVAWTNYSLDNGGTWTRYYGPWPFSFTVCDCEHDLLYYSVDNALNTELVNGPIHLMIDTDPPIFNIPPLTVTISDPYVEVEAHVDDLCSGVCMVEFFRDGSPFGSPVNAPPWVINFIGSDPPPNTMYAIAYDCAGNSATSSVINPYNLQQQQSSHQSSSQQSIIPLFFQILQRLMNIR